MQKLLAYNEYYVPDAYGKYDVSTYEAVVEFRNSVNWISNNGNNDVIDSTLLFSLLTTSPKSNPSNETNWYKQLRLFRLKHNLTEQAVASKIILGEAEKIKLDEKLTEVTVNGGGVLTKLTQNKVITPGYADILIQYKYGDYGVDYSRVWEVKHQASNKNRINAVKEIACAQLERYINAAMTYQQKFNTPLYEGYTIDAFIIPGIGDDYLLIFGEKSIDIVKPITGSGIVYYLECNTIKQAQDVAEKLEYHNVLFEDKGKYTPVCEPGIIYEVYSLDPAVTIGIIVIAGVVFFAVPAIAAGGVGTTFIAGAGAVAQMVTASGTYYLYPATAFA